MFRVFLQRRARTPIFIAYKDWQAHCRRFTLRTQQHYLMVSQYFIKSLLVKRICQIKPYHIENYLNSILQNSTNRTYNAHLTALRSGNKWASQFYGIPNYAQEFPFLKEDPPHQRFLTTEELQKVLAICEPEEKAVIEFLYFTGLRSSEVARIRLDADQQWLTVDGKGRHGRTLPIDNQVRQILTPETILHLSKTTRQSLYSLCSKLAKRAGIQKFGPHSLRHSLVNDLFNAGVFLPHISKYIGHKDTRTTETIYTHFQHKQLRGITEFLHKKHN